MAAANYSDLEWNRDSFNDRDFGRYSRGQAKWLQRQQAVNSAKARACLNKLIEGKR